MTGINNAIGAYAKQDEISKAANHKQTDNVAFGESHKTTYGKTIGEPKLSEKAEKYYEELKRKFHNYDFILVSQDEKENAKANASKYANPAKTVVLIGEDTLEKMATDEKYRKQYEGILSGAAAQINQMKNSMESTGANVKGYGMQVEGDGKISFFAVLKKSSADQKARIEKKAEEKRAEKKADAKKAAKEEREERIKSSHHNIDDDEDTVTISASSIDELLKKISDYNFEERSNSVQTEAELSLGQNIDFKG